ncbi:MAG: tetratricopeptide repeat protein [Candidatus Eremiobacterota bacterium]
MYKKILLFITIVILFINISCDSKEERIKEANKWHMQAWDLVQEKKYDEAIVCFDKALQLDKNNPKILFNKGNALMCQCKYKESLECFDEALKIEPSNDYVKYNRETVLMLLEKEKKNK